MSSGLLTTMVLLGFAVVAGLFVYLTVLDAGKWRKKMDGILLPIGFEPATSDSDKALLTTALAISNPSHPGKRLLKHLYRRQSPGEEFMVFVCDVYFGSASGKARGGNWLLVCLVSQALAVPRFSIYTTPTGSGAATRLFGMLSQWVDLPGLIRITTGDPALDARFKVYVEPNRAELPISRDLLHQLGECAGGASIDAKANTLVLTSISMMADRVRQVLDPQKLQAHIQLATRIYTAVKA